MGRRILFCGDILVANSPLITDSHKFEFIVAGLFKRWVYFRHRDLLAACSLYLLKSLPTSPTAIALRCDSTVFRQFFVGLAFANSS